MRIENMQFADQDHKETFVQLVTQYGINQRNRDYMLLLYLIAVIDPGPHIEDVVIDRGGGRISIKSDAIHKDWTTGTDRRLLRLAFHLFTWGTPTVDKNDPAEDQVKELERYTPLALADGLDYRRSTAMVEAIRLLLFWDSISLED